MGMGCGGCDGREAEFYGGGGDGGGGYTLEKISK